jgi:mono/diheme cytochrome c family protein
MRVILGTVFLCTALAGGGARADQASAAMVTRGKALAEAADCAGCHTADPAKPFAGGDPSSTLRVMLDGAESVTTARAPNAGSMPAYRDKLTDQSIAAVANYIRNFWGNAAPTIDADQVAKARTAR